MFLMLLQKDVFLTQHVVFVKDDVLTDDRVVLAENTGILTNRPKQTAPQLVEEVIIGRVLLCLLAVLLIRPFKG